MRQRAATHPPVAPKDGGRDAPRLFFLLAFALALMGDPVSSVAYTVEAALHALSADLTLLLPTLTVVAGVIAIIVANYHYLIDRYPDGGGAPVVTAAVFGEAWAFLPLASLLVDFALTVSLSVSAAAAAIVSWVPPLAPFRIVLAAAAAAVVAGVTCLGHVGRTLFATLTVAFLGAVGLILLLGFVHPALRTGSALPPGPRLDSVAAVGRVLFAYPVAMAWATGIEGPLAATTQLARVNTRGRRHAGLLSIWLTVGVVGGLSLGLADLVVRLGLHGQPPDMTLVAFAAREVVGRGVPFALFQLISALLLLAAAHSGFAAGAGLLKGLAEGPGGSGPGLLPAWLGRTNRHHSAYTGIATLFVISMALVTVTDARAQVLVLFYAAAIQLAFFAAMLAMLRSARRTGRSAQALLHVAGALAAGGTLVLDALRGPPLASLLAAGGLACLLYLRWLRAGRPRGIAAAAWREVAGEDTVI
jgi:hypothetical protein